MQAAVCIPIYKAQPGRSEIASLKQCLKVLKNYPVIFIAPQSIHFDEYASLCEGVDYKVAKFDNKYFGDIAGYNKLMLSPGFYKRFINYKYILIYQLDAFVFKDDLLYWCSQRYDFIGAPHESANNSPGGMQFLKNYRGFLRILNRIGITRHKIGHVGNGGFSLRKTRKFYLLLKLLKHKADKWPYNEDVFFEYWGNIFYPFFRLPDDKTALRFSIEKSPDEALQKLDNSLPFGCHAFEKYNWETWKSYINIAGH